MAETMTISVRVSSQDVARLDEMRGDGVSRSAVVRELLRRSGPGDGKAELLGSSGLSMMVLNPAETIICAAAARDQAAHLFRAATRLADSVPELRKRLKFTLREIRTPQSGRLIVVSADSERQMG